MKKIGILLLIAVFVGVTFGAVPVFAAAKVLKLAEVHPKGYPTEMADQKFSELFEKLTQGRYKI
ncbi:MAG: hypothetical protein PHI99_06445, partial [Syntrophales bacterium]|nr:hypothetical protein [Syntrophales bacterium]